MLVRRLRGPLLTLAAVFVVGTLGYRVIEGWSWLESVWMVAISLTTIGYGEIHPLSDIGRVFTLVLLALGLSVASWAVTDATGYALSGALAADIERDRRARLLDGLRKHFIVAGFGRTGREVAADLRHAGMAVVVIDLDPTIEDDAHALGAVPLVGDATNDALLRRAGVERASGLAVATASDAVNIFVTLSARQLSPGIRILARVDHQDAAPKALRAGADAVVSPHAIGGTTIANNLLRPSSATFVSIALARSQEEFGVEDVAVRSASLCGALSETQIRRRFGALVVAVHRVDHAFVGTPGPDFVVSMGDVLVVVGNRAAITALRAAAER